MNERPHVTSVLSQCSLEPFLATPSSGPNEARTPGARQGLHQALESSCFIGSYSDIFSKLSCSSWDEVGPGLGSPCDYGRTGYVSPHPGLSAGGSCYSGGCGPHGVGLEGPRPSTAGESQGIVAHGSPKVSRLPEPPVERPQLREKRRGLHQCGAHYLSPSLLP